MVSSFSVLFCGGFFLPSCICQVLKKKKTGSCPVNASKLRRDDRRQRSSQQLSTCIRVFRIATIICYCSSFLICISPVNFWTDKSFSWDDGRALCVKLMSLTPAILWIKVTRKLLPHSVTWLITTVIYQFHMSLSTSGFPVGTWAVSASEKCSADTGQEWIFRAECTEMDFGAV